MAALAGREGITDAVGAGRTGIEGSGGVVAAIALEVARAGGGAYKREGEIVALWGLSWDCG